MPYVETPNDLAEILADLLSIYGAMPAAGCRCVQGPISRQGRPQFSWCSRVCFATAISARIRQSVAMEERLAH